MGVRPYKTEKRQKLIVHRESPCEGREGFRSGFRRPGAFKGGLPVDGMRPLLQSAM